jgi:AraC family transcriptional activator of pobA
MKPGAATNPRDYPGKVVALATVPKVRRYAEHIEAAECHDQWLVRVGHASDRGRWQTPPHAHPGYGQVIFVRKGCGVMNLEGRSVPFEGPCVLLLPADCVHGLDYKVDADRWVVTIHAAYLAKMNTKLREFVQLWSEARIIPLVYSSETAKAVHELIAGLSQEMISRKVGYAVEAEALLTFLLLTLARSACLDQAEGNSARREIHLVERFRELIDQHYCSNLSLRDYASMMAVSQIQLRAACASAAGQSPTKLVHARLITEAKRSLIFGSTSTEQIALSLGFSNAAYFTRFFRKEVGQTPSEFRSSAREGQRLKPVPSI